MVHYVHLLMFHYHISCFLLTGLGSGLDHNLGSYTVTIAAGETTASLDIPLYDDMIYKDIEDIQLRIISSSLPRGVSVSNDKATITIVDDIGKRDFYLQNFLINYNYYNLATILSKLYIYNSLKLD